MNTCSLMIGSPLFMGQKKFDTDMLTDLSTRDELGTELIVIVIGHAMMAYPFSFEH